MTWLRIVSLYFVAAVSVKDWRVIEAAPILNWTLGMEEKELRHYCRNKGWKIEAV